MTRKAMAITMEQAGLIVKYLKPETIADEQDRAEAHKLWRQLVFERGKAERREIEWQFKKMWGDVR